MPLQTYLPQDRLRALARRETLPDRTHGAALFADISGFTALTEGLRDALGPRRGAEELTHHLGIVYSALIAEIEKHDGSVISFAGDAVTCWFDGADAALRAVTCAFDLQAAMRAFAAIVLPGGGTTALSLKVSVATGPARRFVVGDPDLHYIDTLAGTTVARTASGEHLAEKGDVVVDAATATALGADLSIREWRTADDGERFAVPEALAARAPAHEHPALPPIEPAQLRAWIDPSVHEREASGQGSFLTEFRPGAVLFVNFAGIDYDGDDAQARLDAFVRLLQQTADRYGGTVLQLAIGDKGSYAYVNFGALSAHEDDARRAVLTALELRQRTDLAVRIGIAQGVMRVGAYGGDTRRTYGALGDDVNLAARLMMTAVPGEILVSGPVHKAVESGFAAEPRPPLPMKGKAEPLPVFAVTGERKSRAIRLQEPTYALPMVGRVAELELVSAKLDAAAQGKGQVIGVVAEAGMGKSRLVAEIVRAARRKGFVGYGGACRSDALHTPYQAWKSVWQAFFEIDPEHSSRKQLRMLEGEIEDRAPERLDAMPLLNVVLDLAIPDNEFTESLEPKSRQGALHALLEACLEGAAQDDPILVVLEDLHWIDALSIELLEQLAGALADQPVAFVLAYRPSQWNAGQSARIESLPQFTKVALRELTLAEAEQAIRAKLAQLYPARGGALPPGLVDALMARAQGNPFYIEELLNYVRDRGLAPTDLDRIELPDSLHALILSRIDQLTEDEKVTLRVASVIGRLFRADWLTGYYPELGAPAKVTTALNKLSGLDLTPLDSPEPEWRYIFKHIVTHEVTYESLPFATRARLHEQLAKHLEDADAPVEAIAFHYGRSANTAKKIEYLRKAGEAAQRNCANESAIEHFSALLPLLADDGEKFRIHLVRGQVAELMGRYGDAGQDYQAALAAAGDNLASQAEAQFALGKVNRLRGEYATALEWHGRAHEARVRLGDKRGIAQGLIDKGTVLFRTSELVEAHSTMEQGLVLAREVADKPSVALAQNGLGQVAWQKGDYALAQTFWEESLALRREIGERSAIAASLNNVGVLALVRDDYPSARVLLEESLAIRRAIGDRWGIGTALINLGVLAMWRGDYGTARSMYQENLAMRREMGEKPGIALSLYNLGCVALAQGEYADARALCAEALALRRDMGDKGGTADALCGLGVATLSAGEPASARPLLEESVRVAQDSDDKSAKSNSLLAMGHLELVEGRPEARERFLAALHLVATEPRDAAGAIAGLAALALRDGAPRVAAQLLGAVASALATLGVVVDPISIGLHVRTLGEVEAALGKAAFAAACDEGRGWSLAEAVRRASGAAT
ncbi:MAG: tetratricopeptide repeat protein [Burkholderiales bacterium]